MRPVSALELLRVWERGAFQSPVQRALSLLAAAWPDLAPETLADMRIGLRDSMLLTFRERLFGPLVECVSLCPECGERLDLTFSIDDVRTQAEGEIPETVAVDVDGCRVQARLPNSTDLLCLSVDAGLAENQALVLARCVESVSRGDEELSLDDLSESAFQALGAAMARADPQADAQLDVVCPGCGHRWVELFDIATFLWHEIETWAGRMIRDVHLVASTYGWTETDILAMSPRRRQAYLDLILERSS